MKLIENLQEIKIRLNNSAPAGDYFTTIMNRKAEKFLNAAPYHSLFCAKVGKGGKIVKIKVYPYFWRKILEREPLTLHPFSDSDDYWMKDVGGGNKIPEFVWEKVEEEYLPDGVYDHYLIEGGDYQGCNYKTWHKINNIYLLREPLISPYLERKRLLEKITKDKKREEVGRQGHLVVYKIRISQEEWIELNNSSYSSYDEFMIFNHFVECCKHLKNDNRALIFEGSNGKVVILSYDHLNEGLEVEPGEGEALLLEHPFPSKNID
jgi:hypothetical protein